jgi:sulfate adenylyltransferase (ADP) / ATP adenylyltransferase
MTSRQQLTAGTLWPLLVSRTQRAIARGVLQPIGTRQVFIDDGGVRFVVRQVSSLERKAAQKQKQSDVTDDPFLSYEEDLFVADISPSHVALLNKFNVIEHHLLIVTRRFEEQEALLTVADLRVLWSFIAEFTFLAFYNGGRVAGASQRHKHLQIVPLPLANEGPAIPIEPLLAGVSSGATITTVPGLPFAHAYTRLDPTLVQDARDAADVTLERYHALLNAVGLRALRVVGELRQSAPYNLLITRNWMLLVPRSREYFHSVSVNALGFAGSLFVRNEEEMQAISAAGPMRVLQQVACNERR